MQKHKDTVEYTLNELHRITLPEKVKTHMRSELAAYADFHKTSPKQEPMLAPTRTFAWLSIHAWYRAGAALVAVLLLAGGTAYASEESLPGSPLYTVKVNFKEPIEVALATTPRQKAEIHAELAEKRLVEATKLAVNASLDADTQEYLEQEFGEHVDGSLAAAETLEKNGEAEASLDVRSHLESSLVAHADILDLVEEKLQGSGADVSHESTKNLVRAIKLRQEVVSETRLALERDLADDATQTDTLALVTKTAGAVTAEAEASTFSTVMDRVEESGEALAEAKESLEHDGSEDLRRAFRKAREAGRASDVVSTLLKNKDILMQVDIALTATTTPEAATTTEPVMLPVEEVVTPQEPALKTRSWWSPR